MRLLRSHRRGGIYLAVLGTALIVTLLGLAGLTVIRTLSASVRDEDRAAEARDLAMDSYRLMAYYMANTTNWRLATSGTWYTTTLDIGTPVQYKLVDEVDGNLSNDLTQPVKAYFRAIRGNAGRCYSVVLIPLPLPNLLYNGDAESGIAGWRGYGNCHLDVQPVNPHGGGNAIRVSYRDAWWAGPNQEITSRITSGTKYNVEAWVRLDNGTSDVRITVELISTGSGTQYFTTSNTSVSGAWKKVAGQLTLSWSGTLNRARLYVESPYVTTPMTIDDCRMQPSSALAPLRPMPGTWQQESTD